MQSAISEQNSFDTAPFLTKPFFLSTFLHIERLNFACKKFYICRVCFHTKKCWKRKSFLSARGYNLNRLFCSWRRSETSQLVWRPISLQCCEYSSVNKDGHQDPVQNWSQILNHLEILISDSFINIAQVTNPGKVRADPLHNLRRSKTFISIPSQWNICHQSILHRGRSTTNIPKHLCQVGV